MKRIGVINQPIAAVISGLGHTDTITIADAGLPIPAGPQRIDLALTAGTPAFIQTLEVVLSEFYPEKVIVAEEMQSVSPHVLAAVTDRVGNVPIELVPHSIFKHLTGESKAVIRTGEFTPYANIILVAGPWGFDLGQ